MIELGAWDPLLPFIVRKEVMKILMGGFVGGPDVVGVSSYTNELLAILRASMIGDYVTDLQYVGFFVHVDGSLISTERSGVGRTTYSSLRSQVSTDIWIPVDMLRGRSGAEIKTYIVECFTRALAKTLESVKRHNIALDSESFKRDFQSALNSFQASPAPPQCSSDEQILEASRLAVEFGSG